MRHATYTREARHVYKWVVWHFSPLKAQGSPHESAPLPKPLHWLFKSENVFSCRTYTNGSCHTLRAPRSVDSHTYKCVLMSLKSMRHVLSLHLRVRRCEMTRIRFGDMRTHLLVRDSTDNAWTRRISSYQRMCSHDICIDFSYQRMCSHVYINDSCHIGERAASDCASMSRTYFRMCSHLT